MSISKSVATLIPVLEGLAPGKTIAITRMPLNDKGLHFVVSVSQLMTREDLDTIMQQALEGVGESSTTDTEAPADDSSPGLDPGDAPGA